MKILCISDTHGFHRDIDHLPKGDTIIHCGDFCNRGTKEDAYDFFEWFGTLPYRNKLVIAGNHDRIFDSKFQQTDEDRIWVDELIGDAEVNHGIDYLQNSGVEIDGIRFWGSPITPDFYPERWAFNCPRGVTINRYWKQIPVKTDIIITHGPPAYKLDWVIRGEYVGCSDLAYNIEMLKPRYHLFGHIHESYGVVETPDTTYINASLLDERYRMVNKPIVFEI